MPNFPYFFFRIILAAALVVFAKHSAAQEGLFLPEAALGLTQSLTGSSVNEGVSREAQFKNCKITIVENFTNACTIGEFVRSGLDRRKTKIDLAGVDRVIVSDVGSGGLLLFAPISNGPSTLLPMVSEMDCHGISHDRLDQYGASFSIDIQSWPQARAIDYESLLNSCED